MWRERGCAAVRFRPDNWMVEEAEVPAGREQLTVRRSAALNGHGHIASDQEGEQFVPRVNR